MLELWGMWSTHLLPSLAGPLKPGVIAPDRILSTGQIELSVLMLNWTVWNRTVLRFKLCTYAQFTKDLLRAMQRMGYDDDDSLQCLLGIS